MDYKATPNFRPAVQNTRKLPVRSAWVRVEYESRGEDRGGADVSEEVDFYGLNTRFNVEINPGNFYPRAQIDVCNLSRQYRDYLTNYRRFQTPELRFIRLYAGYIQDGESRDNTPELFSGSVVFTSFTNPPDIWTCMEVLHRHQSAMSEQEWLVKGTVPRKNILEQAAARMGLKLDLQDTPPNNASNFQSSGDGKRLLRDLQLLCPGYAVFIRNGALTVYEKKRDQPGPGETVWVVREDTGLVGIPSAILPKGVDCDLILNPAILPGDWMKLESVHQPLASGLYRILRVRHHGELRGNDFFTSLETTRPVKG